MKKIHLLRHAKSDWGDASIADINRQLNVRGVRTAQLMALKLHEAGCHFVNIFCSPAVRAQSTISLINEQLPEIALKWKTDEALYTFDSNCLRQWFQSLDESITEVLVVGHNPGLTNFCNALSHGDIQNIPTCGYVKLIASNPCTWPEISKTTFIVDTFLKPKELMLN